MESYLAFDSLNKASLFWGFPLFFFLASIFLPVVICFSMLVGIIKKSRLYIQCAYQLTFLSILLGGLFGCIFLLFILTYFQEIQNIPTIYKYIFWLICGTYYLGLLLESISFVLWRMRIALPVGYTLLSFLSGTCFSVCIIIVIFVIGYAISGELFIIQHETDSSVIIGLLFPTLMNPLWLVVLVLHFIEAAAAGSIGLLWLWCRRNKDNFGRDYYMIAANWCADWAAYGAWVYVVSFMAVAFYTSKIQLLLTWPNILTLILCSISAIIWTVIAYSKKPMQYKIGILCSIIFFGYGLTFGSYIPLFS